MGLKRLRAEYKATSITTTDHNFIRTDHLRPSRVFVKLSFRL